MYREQLVNILEPLQGMEYTKLAEIGDRLKQGTEEEKAISEMLRRAVQLIITQVAIYNANKKQEAG